MMLIKTTFYGNFNLIMTCGKHVHDRIISQRDCSYCGVCKIRPCPLHGTKR